MTTTMILQSDEPICSARYAVGLSALPFLPLSILLQVLNVPNCLEFDLWPKLTYKALSFHLKTLHFQVHI